MNPTLSQKIEMLLEIAEIKRIYVPIETSLFKNTPACLMVTSALRGEGKTTLTAGLATVAARESNKRVLAIDLNWHAPALHSYFGLDLIEASSVNGTIQIENLVHNSGMENLDVLPAVQLGKNPSEPYGDENALGEEIISKAREIYDIVFLDMSKIFPPNRRMMDPLAILREADGVVMVVLANATPRHQVKRAKYALETAGANILGLVVNQFGNPLS